MPMSWSLTTLPMMIPLLCWIPIEGGGTDGGAGCRNPSAITTIPAMNNTAASPKTANRQGEDGLSQPTTRLAAPATKPSPPTIAEAFVPMTYLWGLAATPSSPFYSHGIIANSFDNYLNRV